MITPQDIREKTFEKAVFGGYDMAAVDSLLEEISSDLELLQKENAVLKGKIKVLVNKVEEYRSNEDAIRMAVVSAQRLGNIIELEAREKANAALAESEAKATRMMADAQLKVEAEEARLAAAKKTSVEFVENMKLLCARQAGFLDKVGEMDFVQEYYAAKAAEPEAAPAPMQEAPAAPAEMEEEPVEIHETVKSIEETIAKVAEEPVSNVRPDIQAAPAYDDLPTRAFQLVTDPDEDLEQTAQFSFDGFSK